MEQLQVSGNVRWERLPVVRTGYFWNFWVMHFSSNHQLLNEIVAYLELFCVVAHLVSLSNIDNNNGKKNIKRKRSIKQNKNSEHSSHFVPVLFPVIVWLWLSDVIRMAMRLFIEIPTITSLNFPLKWLRNLCFCFSITLGTLDFTGSEHSHDCHVLTWQVSQVTAAMQIMWEISHFHCPYSGLSLRGVGRGFPLAKYYECGPWLLS